MEIYMKSTEAASGANTISKDAVWQAEMAKARRYADKMTARTRRKMEVVKTLVGPALATVLLERNGRNRPLGEVGVAAFTRLMRDGKFLLLAHAVAVGRDGQLNDGQHKLAAVVRTGIPVHMMVAWGEEVEGALAHDQGGRGSKTAGDALSMERVPYKNEAAAVTKNLMMWGKDRNARRFSNAEVVATYHANPGLAVAVKRASTIRLALKIETTPIALAYFFIARDTKHPDKFDEFFDKLLTGAIAEANSPILRLREGLRNRLFGTDVVASHYRFVRMVAAAIVAWNGFVEGRNPPYAKMNWSPARGPFPEVL